MRILAFVICGILFGAAFSVLISRQHRRSSIPSSADEVTRLRHRVEALESRSDAERAILDLEEGLAWAEACEAQRYPGGSDQSFSVEPLRLCHPERPGDPCFTPAAGTRPR